MGPSKVTDIETSLWIRFSGTPAEGNGMQFTFDDATRDQRPLFESKTPDSDPPRDIRHEHLSDRGGSENLSRPPIPDSATSDNRYYVNSIGGVGRKHVPSAGEVSQTAFVVDIPSHQCDLLQNGHCSGLRSDVKRGDKP